MLGYLNALVHAVMYTYYLLSIWMPSVKTSKLIKRNITRLQMVSYGPAVYDFIRYAQQVFVCVSCPFSVTNRIASTTDKLNNERRNTVESHWIIQLKCTEQTTLRYVVEFNMFIAVFIHHTANMSTSVQVHAICRDPLSFLSLVGFWHGNGHMITTTQNNRVVVRVFNESPERVETFISYSYCVDARTVLRT